jgi:hypothetical protein
MLRLVSLVDRWREIARDLPEGWREADLQLTVDGAADRARATALLGSAGAARSGERIRLTTARGGGAASAEAIRRLLGRLDAEGIRGELELVDVREGDTERLEPVVDARRALAASWDAAVGDLPSDWSDLQAEVELRSSDHLERAALLMAPLNPLRDGSRRALRFRVARRFGYGASPGMARRCLERCDREGMVGAVQILRALSETDPVKTQGPVWYVGGRVV